MRGGAHGRVAAGAISFATLIVTASVAGAICVGDCPPVNEVVSISELVTGVNIALARREVSACPGFDANASSAVEVNELIQGVRNALNGCASVGTSPTATSIASETPTPMAIPTPTATLAGGPRIVFRGIAAADDKVRPPTRFENQIPVYELPLGQFFHVVVEVAIGSSGRAPGLVTFRNGAAPDLQIQSSRDLGDGNPQVCDGAQLDFGIPAVDPPRFDADPMLINALNDFGCRFPDGLGNPLGRGCADSGCVLFEDGLRGCVSGETQVQFCSRSISINESFPQGETVLSMRALDVLGAPGPVVQMIIRIGL